MTPKAAGFLISALGVFLILISAVAINISDDKEWFYVLLAGGGYLVWVGLAKYRAV